MKLLTFKYALRHIRRYKEYSLLNILGLTLGMASAILIMLWIEGEVTTDTFHKNRENLYALNVVFDYSGEKQIYNSITAPLAPAMEEQIPEIEAACRVTYRRDLLVRKGDQKYNEPGHYVDSNFFRLFSFPFIAGNPGSALDNPNSVVISEDLSLKLFGQTNSLGQTLTIRDSEEELFTVTGVFKKHPANSSLAFNFVVPFRKYEEYQGMYLHWGNFNMRTFILTQPGTSVEMLDEKIDACYQTSDEMLKPDFFVQRFDESYLYGNFKESKYNPTGIILYVRIFFIIAVFVVFLACMNYTNLATAVASKRGREVGIKKVFGSGRFYIIRQFTSEAVLLTIASFLFAVLLVQILLPYFNTYIDSQLVFDVGNTSIIAILTGILLITILLSGTFPALYISSFKPMRILKDAVEPNKGIPRLRKVLVISQFIVTIGFMCSSLIVYKQIQYIQKTDLGFDEENVVFFDMGSEIMEHARSFQQELMQQEGILSVCFTDMEPQNVTNNTGDPTWRGKPDDFQLNVAYFHGDYNVCKTLGVDVVAGRDFDPAIASDTNSLLINETLAGIMGMENSVGEIIEYWGRKEKVVGVVKDFHIKSLRNPMRPLMIINSTHDMWIALIRIDGTQNALALKNIKKVIASFDPTMPFDYRFMDEDIASRYETERILSKVSLLFTLLTTVISCLGLFGLALFTAQQRTKEIGIRKSIGARNTQVMGLLTKTFLSWILVAFAISSVLTYYLMYRWLETYAYRIKIGVGIFILTALVILAIALVTVSWHAWRVASRNPVEALRYE